MSSSLLLVSCALAALWGAGVLFFSAFPAGRGLLARLGAGGTRALLAALPLTAGLLVNYFLSFFLTFSRLTPLLALLAAGGWVYAFRAGLFRAGPARDLRLLGAFLWVFLAVHLYIALQPLKDWDARSIWFLHAKLIFEHDGAVLGVASFAHPSISYSHPDYPKLVPALAAQFAALAGGWNEYLPKLALSVLLFNALAYLAAFAAAAEIFLWFSCSALLFGRSLFWNGFMDGYLALFGVLLALLLLGLARGGEQERDAGLPACLLLGGLMAGLKNDAFLWFAPALAAAFAFRRRGAAAPAFSGPQLGLAAASAGLALSGFLCWRYACGALGLQNAMLSSQFAGAALGRLADLRGAVPLIAGRLALDTHLWYLLPSAAVAWKYSRARGGERAAAAGCLLLASALYAVVLFFAYAATCYDLAWQLATSVSRVTLVARLALFWALTLLGAGAMARRPG